MTLLIVYISVALGFSFLCSIAEAVILSVSRPYIALLIKEGRSAGALLKHLKEDINKPLAAILTLNTVAHTVGAAGAGAQAAAVFGDGYVGVASAILTLLILVFSEIIPKTLGAHYWRALAPSTAYALRWLVILLYPFVKMSEALTSGLSHGPTLRGFSREEFSAMADLGEREGQLGLRESTVIKNLFLLHDTPVRSALTPRTVVFSLQEAMTVSEFFEGYDKTRFSRIPVYQESREKVTGFVLRADLLLAQARGNGGTPLSTYRRDLPATSPDTSLAQAFEHFLAQRAHMMLVVDEYGGMEGILTLEDIIETLLGMEIIDESDHTDDMQKHARRLWRRRAKAMGLDIDE